MENHDIVTCAWLGNTDDFTAVATLQLDLHKHKSQPGDDVNVNDEPSIQGLGLGNMDKDNACTHKDGKELGDKKSDKTCTHWDYSSVHEQ